MKKFRCILISTCIIGIIVYNILIQKNILYFDNTIYNMVYMYIAIIIIWITIEMIAYNKNHNDRVKKTKINNYKNKNRVFQSNNVDNNSKYKTSFGDNTISKIADGYSDKKSKYDLSYCSNCHRQIYSSNYTGTNLCVECKNHYYKKDDN